MSGLRSRLADPRTWLALISMTVVVALVAVDVERAGPGELSATHAQIEALRSSEGCARCHGAEQGALARGCLDCHESIAEQLATRTGLHATLEQPNDCARCHLEHHGADFALVDAHAFAMAGIPDRDAYDHTGLDFGLGGAHAGLACSACHSRADAALLAPGETRFLGLDQECEACHADPHDRSMSKDCAACHGQERPFAEVARFEHTARFPLEGAHARRACTDCHEPGSARAVAALSNTRPGALPPAVRACADCHESPHRPGFIASFAAGRGTAPPASCSMCHPLVPGGFAAAALLELEDHGATGFPLVSPHDAVECAACHANGVAVASAPAREPHDCAACHADPHAGQFAGVQPDAGCLDCHDAQHFVPHAFDLARHARTAFALDGSHASVGCEACHFAPQEDPEGARVFRGTPARCEACHADPHERAFASPATGTTDCASCHSTGAFHPTLPGVFDHGARTGFALAGAHARASCESCHPRAAAPDANGRTLGRVSERFPGSTKTCVTCHADPHDGVFAEPTSGTTDCASCHSTDAFAPSLPGAFDHGARTGFALAGAHARASCESCHPRAAAPDAHGRTLGRVSERFPGSTGTCVTCHADPHGGVFAEPSSGTTDCASCHSTDAFTPALPGAFDHGARTGFALAGGHARASCEDCHPRMATDAAGRSFGHAAGRSCSTCHADPHAGQFAAPRTRATDCSRCHATGSFAASGFDHSRDARFALDRVHSALACATCHAPWKLADGRVAVRYKPLGTACADCHLPGKRR